MEQIEIIVNDELAGSRADKAIATLAYISRSRVLSLMQEGHIYPMVQPDDRVTAGQTFTITLPPSVEDKPLPQDIPLDIVYEDEDILVIDKPAGMAVHQGAGNHAATLVNAILAHCKGQLSGIGGALRPGIVHRLDKDTSGLMVVAKNDAAHESLARQLESRKMGRVYHAVVWGALKNASGTITTQIGRARGNRQKMAVLADGTGRVAQTDYKTLKTDGKMSLVQCSLRTGRTHQIRVHMAHMGNPVVGDSLYGRKKSALINRQALHAVRLELTHPRTGEKMEFQSKGYPKDMQAVLAAMP